MGAVTRAKQWLAEWMDKGEDATEFSRIQTEADFASRAARGEAVSHEQEDAVEAKASVSIVGADLVDEEMDTLVMTPEPPSFAGDALSPQATPAAGAGAGAPAAGAPAAAPAPGEGGKVRFADDQVRPPPGASAGATPVPGGGALVPAGAAAAAGGGGDGKLVVPEPPRERTVVKDTGGYSGSGLGPAAAAQVASLRGDGQATPGAAPGAKASAAGVSESKAGNENADPNSDALVPYVASDVNAPEAGVRIGRRLLQRSMRVGRTWRDVRGNLSAEVTHGTTMPADMDLVMAAQEFAEQRVGVYRTPNEMATAAEARRKVELALVRGLCVWEGGALRLCGVGVWGWLGCG